MDIVVRWAEGLQCVGSGWSGHGVLIDSDPTLGGFDAAPRPVELLLMSLCSCTGMDVASILKKMRMEYDRFEVGASGEREAEHPKIFNNIELVYHIWGTTIDEEKFVKAINLSLDQYCPVANTLKKAVDLSFRYEINPTAVMKAEG